MLSEIQPILGWPWWRENVSQVMDVLLALWNATCIFIGDLVIELLTQTSNPQAERGPLVSASGPWDTLDHNPSCLEHAFELWYCLLLAWMLDVCEQRVCLCSNITFLCGWNVACLTKVSNTYWSNHILPRKPTFCFWPYPSLVFGLFEGYPWGNVDLGLPAAALALRRFSAVKLSGISWHWAGGLLPVNHFCRVKRVSIVQCSMPKHVYTSL